VFIERFGERTCCGIFEFLGTENLNFYFLDFDFLGLSVTAKLKFSLNNVWSVYPLAKIAADFNSANFKSIKQHFGEQKFGNFSLKFID
jgi:hypothetical protein